MSSMVQYIFYLAFLVALAIPVGSYISKASVPIQDPASL